MLSIKLTSLFVTLVFLLFLTVSLPVSEAGPIKMRISTHMAGKDATGMACKKLGELINARSKGRIKAQVWTDAELGNQREHVEMLHDGSLECFPNLATGTARYVPELACFELPYTYKDDDHMVRVLKALRPYVEKLLAPHNFKPIGYCDIGFRHMLNKKRPIYTVADLKGLKMRAPNPVYAAMFNALGASATTVTWSEVYTALQSGIVDGMEASPGLIYPMRFQEQAKFLSKTYHIGACYMFMYNKKWFGGLPKDLQKVVADATGEASEYQFETQMRFEKENLDKLIAEGVKVNDVKDINEFMERVAVWRSKFIKDKGPNWVKLYKKIKAVK